MAQQSSQDILRRLKSIEGHVRGVRLMIEDDAYCVDVVQQIVAIQRALKKVASRVLDQHLHSCVTEAVRGRDVAERERVLQELIEVFEATGKA